MEAFLYRRAHYDGSVFAWRHSYTEELIMMEVCPLEAFLYRRAHYDGSVFAWRHSHTEELIMMEVCLHGGIPTQKSSL